jgi:phosphatidylserine/phosphatidylglycerophosphate/cardiolipin synthase-like enzyme
VNGAKTSINVQAYSFTSQPIINALIAAKQRGVDVKIILDKSQLHENVGAKQVLAAGIPTWVDEKHDIAHNKIMIIDAQIVITGSFNFTANAEKNNAENCLVITGPTLAATYQANWQEHQGHSIVYTGQVK